MDITKFYELRTRLYNTAAAGCMTVSEDFRLKRAVEDFKPLSSANKAFEKLYALCEKLFSEKPDTVLPDCIALAEALAVTQGSFADSAETKPAEGESVPAQKHASDLSAVKELMRKGSDDLWKLSAEYKDTLRDPRVVTAFLNYLETGKSNENFKVFCEIMCEICGKTLVPGLKATVKESGRQLQYIAKLAGDEENEFFRGLAKDESTPEKLRLAAISALSCSLENGALLAELFNTGSAKIKQAALLAMAEMDAPEAEPIFEKLLADYKKNKKLLAEPIKASSGKACTEFVRKYLTQLKQVAEDPNNKEKQFKAKVELSNDVEWMLENKSGLDDVFLVLEADREREGSSKVNSNEVLMKGLSGKNGDAVRAQIDRLYAKEPKTFQEAKAFSELLAHPDIKPDLIDKDGYDCADLVASVRYIPLLDGYYLRHIYMEKIDLLPLLPFCKRFPEWVSQCIRDNADEAVKRFNELQAPTRAEMLEKARKLGFEDTRNCDALSVASNTISGMVGPLAYYLHDLLEDCVPEDREPLIQAAMYMIRKCLPFISEGNFERIIKEYPPDITPKEHSDMIIDFMINNMVINLRPATYGTLYAVSEGLTPDEQTEAFKKLRTRISEWKGKMIDNEIDYNLNLIDDYLKKTESKG